MRERKHFPTFVLTFLLKGGLYQRMFLGRVTLDLQAGKHFPYTKEGNLPLYVHNKSNHPPSILKNIPDAINKRLSEISSDRQCFDNSKAVYQEALNKSGYNYNLSYNESRNEKQQSRKNRPRNILWYNPPFSKNVKTNVGKCFLSLIDQHFPKSHPLQTFKTQ